MPSARTANIIGGLIAVALTAFSGRNSGQYLLMVLFAIWVAAPFVLLEWAHRASPTWPPPTKTTLDVVTVLVTVATIALYTYRALRPPRTTGAFIFTITPPVSIILATATIGVAALRHRRG